MTSAVDRLLGAAPSRPRADARANVGRLVEAAREGVAEVGVDVTAHDIARRAGVGIGTLYRRVGSREALLEAVLLETAEAMVELARDASADPDPWHGFTAFAAEYVLLRVTSCGLNDALGDTTPPALAGLVDQLRLLLGRMVEAAQSAGALRDDVTVTDVAFALAAVVPTGHTLGIPTPSTQWRRTLEIVLDGLRAAPDRRA